MKTWAYLCKTHAEGGRD